MEGVKADLGVRDGGADRALVLAAHVDRDRPDRLPCGRRVRRRSPARWRCCGPASTTRSRPSCGRRPRSGSGDGGDRRSRRRRCRPGPRGGASSRWSATTRSTIAPDRVPADPQQPGDRRERHLLRQPRDDVLEVARVVRARPRPRHRLQPHAAVTAAQQPQLALDPAAAGAQIEVPPALDAAVVDLEPAGLAAAPSTRAAGAAAGPSRHPVGGEADVDHGCPGQAEQPLECRGDAHVALLARPLILRTASSLRAGRRRVTRVLRNLRRTSEAAKALLRRSTPRAFTHKSSGDPIIIEMPR